MKIIVTGGLGFIGREFVSRLLAVDRSLELVVVDKATYAAAGGPPAWADDPRVTLLQADIAQPCFHLRKFAAGAKAIVNFAAETHVDRSLVGADPFIQTNVVGVQRLIGLARDLSCRLVQVSTDEVYGDRWGREPRVKGGIWSAKETDAIEASSPYSASKAAGDLLILAAHRSFGLDCVITRGCNTFGPYQHPEKLVPLAITNLLQDRCVPVYGDGSQIREWMRVEDHAWAIAQVMTHGEPGEIFNLGTGYRKSNLELVRELICWVKGFGPSYPQGVVDTWFDFVADRPGHDRAYALQTDKFADTFGPLKTDAADWERTVAWYRHNADWWRPIREGKEYAGLQRELAGRGMTAPDALAGASAGVGG